MTDEQFYSIVPLLALVVGNTTETGAVRIGWYALAAGTMLFGMARRFIA